MNSELEARFTAFAKGLDGTECIDELTLTPEQNKAQKADFFFNGRQIIAELQALYTNTEGKIETILEPCRDTPEWPHFYGEQELHKVISFLPDSSRRYKDRRR